MFDFAETTIDMTAKEILNYYRNLYYAEPQVTERGIMANAINDVLADVVPESEVVREIFDEILKMLDEYSEYFHEVGHIYNEIAEFKKKYTEEKK